MLVTNKTGDGYTEGCYIRLTPVQFEKFLNQEIKLKSKSTRARLFTQGVEQIIIKENGKYMVKKY